MFDLKKTLTIALLAASVNAQASLACIVPAPFKEAYIDEALIVFRGSVESISLLHTENGETAILSVSVSETFKGPRNLGPREFLWRDFNFGVPHELSDLDRLHSGEFVVGLVSPTEELTFRRPNFSVKKTAEQLSKLPHLLNHSCAAPFLFGVEGDSIKWISFDNYKNQRDNVEAALREQGILK
jgi:hypothetical protein